MSSTFTGFSEEDLKRIKSGESGSNSATHHLITKTNIKKIDKIGALPKRQSNAYKLPALQRQNSDDDNIENLFDKCRLSIKTPTSPSDGLSNNNNTEENRNVNEDNCNESVNNNDDNINEEVKINNATEEANHELERKESIVSSTSVDLRKQSTDSAPDLVRCVDGYTEDDKVAHKAKLQDLQLRQKIMEEQNKKRKEMLARALADRTKQTVEEVQRLEKIKKELSVLDGQFSQDVAMLRKKIDQACLTYADAEKHYLKVEKEFLHAKIQLQKEKEKKELLTEHLCALITHNETRKAQKLETLMLELASEKVDVSKSEKHLNANNVLIDDDDTPVIVDGVDQKTGKIVEFNSS